MFHPTTSHQRLTIIETNSNKATNKQINKEIKKPPPKSNLKREVTFVTYESTVRPPNKPKLQHKTPLAIPRPPPPPPSLSTKNQTVCLPTLTAPSENCPEVLRLQAKEAQSVQRPLTSIELVPKGQPGGAAADSAGRKGNQSTDTLDDEAASSVFEDCSNDAHEELEPLLFADAPERGIADERQLDPSSTVLAEPGTSPIKSVVTPPTTTTCAKGPTVTFSEGGGGVNEFSPPVGPGPITTTCLRANSQPAAAALEIAAKEKNVANQEVISSGHPDNNKGRGGTTSSNSHNPRQKLKDNLLDKVRRKSLRLHPKAQGSKPAGTPLGLRRRRSSGSKSLRCNCWRHLAEKCGTMWSSRNRMLMDTDGDDVAFLSGSGMVLQSLTST